MFKIKDKIEGQEPPCKRFTSQSLDDINYNMILSYSHLRESGCSRLDSIRFLTKKNCKYDATKSFHGPSTHQILPMKHNKYHCISGWQFGRQKFIVKTEQDDVINKIITEEDEYNTLEKMGEEHQKKIQYEVSHHERYQKNLDKKYSFQGNITIDNILGMKKQVRKLYNILDLKKIHELTNSLDSEISSIYKRTIFNTQRSHISGYALPSSKDIDIVLSTHRSSNKLQVPSNRHIVYNKKRVVPRRQPISHKNLERLETKESDSPILRPSFHSRYQKQLSQPSLPIKFQQSFKQQKTLFPTEPNQIKK